MVPADTTVGDIHLIVPVIATVVTMATVALISVTTVLMWIMVRKSKLMVKYLVKFKIFR